MVVRTEPSGVERLRPPDAPGAGRAAADQGSPLLALDGTLGRHLRLVIGGVVLLVAVVCGAGTWSQATYGARLTADEPQYLLTAISLGEDHDLDVSDERAALRYLPFHELGLPIQAKILPGGHMINPHDPLLPVLLVVPMAVGGWVAAKLLLALVAGALAGLLVWTAVRRLGVAPLPATVVVLAFALSPPFAVYGTQVYPELPAALAVAIAAAALLGRPRLATAAVAGLALGSLPWLSAKHGLVALAVTAVGALLWRRQARRPTLLMVGLVGAAGLAYVVFSHRVYGGWTPYAVGSHFSAGELTVMGSHIDWPGRSSRLVGLLADRSAGLVPWAPVYLVAVPALAALVRTRPRRWSLLAVPLAAGWFTATFVAETIQGWEWPARQILAVLPLAVLATAWWVGRVLWPARPRVLGLTALLGVAGLVSYAVLVVEATTGRIALVVDATRTVAPAYRLLRPLVPDYRTPGPATWTAHALWIVVLAVLAAYGWRSARSGDGRADPREVPRVASVA